MIVESSHSRHIHFRSLLSLEIVDRLAKRKRHAVRFQLIANVVTHRVCFYVNSSCEKVDLIFYDVKRLGIIKNTKG